MFSKLLVFNLAITVAEFLLVYIFGIPFEEFMGVFGIILIYVLANAFFFIYDRLIDLVTFIYNKKWRKRFERLLK